MSYIDRAISKQIKQLSKQYPVIGITGPRQSGKTTLIQHLFKKGYLYCNLEDLEQRAFAIEDPKGFLNQSEFMVIDEAQNVPELFSYIQVIVDQTKRPAQFIISGSQNFILLETISQTLAGRIALFELLPLSIEEIKQFKKTELTLEKVLFQGFYPKIYSQSMDPSTWYANYLKTYVERDVRTIKLIENLGKFQVFLKMCAGRCGQLINYTSLSNDCGISTNTVRAWMDLLELSFIGFRVQPYYKNFNKRLMKSSKFYFYDTGLLCYLLQIHQPKDLVNHYLRGGIFESYVFSEIIKNSYKEKTFLQPYFFRDKTNHEIDCILESKGSTIAIEIKSAKTINAQFFDSLKFWEKITQFEKRYLIYGGSTCQKRGLTQVLAWDQVASVFD